MKQFFVTLVVATALIAATRAVDINPSRPDPVKDKQTSGKGALFQRNKGAAKRMERANSINFDELETKIELKPTTLSIRPTADGETPVFRPTITFRNKGKRTFAFEFPNSQRFDIQIKNAAGQVVYTWSDDKEFVQTMSNILLNPGDSATLPTTAELAHLPLSAWDIPAAPGVYTVEVVVANYPEVSGKAALTLTP